MPLITVRREDATILHLHGALSTLACASGWCSVIRSAVRLGSGQPQEMLQLAAEHEVVLAEELLRTRLVKMGKKDLGLGHQFHADEDLAGDGGPLGAKGENVDRIGQLLTGQHLAVKVGLRDL